MIEIFNILKQKKDEQSESIIEDGMRYFNLRIKQMKLPPPRKSKKKLFEARVLRNRDAFSEDLES